MQYNEKLDAELKALEGDMIETLQRWIRVPSVRAERSADNAPFGENVRRALDTAMADLKRLGMEPRDVDGYCCDTEIGQGDEVIAVLSHLDVVPEGEGWAHDPYGAEIIDGRMIGRGTSDDKGPGVAALFAMKAIMNAGIPLRRRCRLILGCDEECGMQDLEYYDHKIGLPERGFSPDANFPLINTEKGGLKLALHAALDDARLIEIASGTRVNVVPNQAVAVIAGDWREAAADAFDVEDEDCALESELVGGDTRLTVTGVSAHASVPEKGKNAAKMLVHVLAKLGIGGAPIALLDEAARIVKEGFDRAQFDRLVRSAVGRRTRDLDSFESVCYRMCAYHFDGVDYFSFPEAYASVTPEDVLQFIRQVIRPERAALSIILPNESEESA